MLFAGFLMETSARKEENTVIKVIDNVLINVFGKESTRLIYNYLETHYSLHPNEFLEKIDLFAKGLESFLSSSAHLIENKILDDIYSAYGLTRKVEPNPAGNRLDFACQIRTATQYT